MLVASTLPYAALRLIKHVVCHTHDAVLLCVAQDQLKSIRYCVQETCNFDVLYAYLSCGNYDFNCTAKPKNPTSASG